MFLSYSTYAVDKPNLVSLYVFLSYSSYAIEYGSAKNYRNMTHIHDVIGYSKERSRWCKQCPSHLSDIPIFRYSNCLTFHLSDIPTVRHSNCQTSQLSDIPTVRHHNCQTSQLSDIPTFRHPNCQDILTVRHPIYQTVRGNLNFPPLCTCNRTIPRFNLFLGKRISMGLAGI